MKNILLISNDLCYAKNLINTLVTVNINIRLCGIANNEEESISILRNIQIDSIIIELPLQNYEKIIHLFGNKKSIILILNAQNELFLRKLNSKNSCVNYLVKSSNINNDANNINYFFTTNKDIQLSKISVSQELSIKKRINNELEYIGYNFEHFGSMYIAETIYLLYTSNNYYNYNLERDIYPIIAKKVGKSVNNVKCNIKNATEIMYYENAEEKIMKYLEISDSRKPRPKEIIKTVIKKISK